MLRSNNLYNSLLSIKVNCQIHFPSPKFYDLNIQLYQKGKIPLIYQTLHPYLAISYLSNQISHDLSFFLILILTN